jgi:hypothetical protein
MDKPRRTVTGVIDQVSILLDAVSDVRSTLAGLRGENLEAHKSIDSSLHLLRREVDGVIATQQAHGTSLTEQRVSCAHRHAHDTDEVRRVRAIDQRQAAIEQGNVHRAASRTDLWKALGGLAAVLAAAVASARLFLG